MKCSQFFNRGKDNDPQTGSGLNSMSGSNHSTKSRVQTQLPNLYERPNSLRVFTLPELKQMTKKFSLSSKLGDGGFGSVYKGITKISVSLGRRDFLIKLIV